MKKNTVKITCRIDTRIFRRFALFDTFRLKKHWRLPVLFLLIMLAFSVICFFSGKPESWLPGSLLLLIGLGMPAVYIGTFLAGVRKQSDRLKLKKPRAMYTITMAQDGVSIHNEFKAEEDVCLAWDKVWGVVRRRGDVYLYAAPTRAFILPAGQAEPDDGTLWDLVTSCLPKNKVTDLH